MRYFQAFWLASLLLISGLWLNPALATDVKFTPSITIPNSNFQRGQELMVTGSTKTICDYIIAYFQYGIGILAVLAVVMIAVAGLTWLTSAGNAGGISKAKKRITDAIFGLAVALFSFVILSTINKELVICKNFTLPAVTEKRAELAKNIVREPTCKIVSFRADGDGVCPLGYDQAETSKCVRPDGSLNGNPNDQNGWGYLCCCPNTKMEDKDFCTTAGEGATCKVNGSWGFCEDISGRGLVCRSCKKITGKASQRDVHSADFVDSERCYRNSVNWECPGANGVCGRDGTDMGADCNMSMLRDDNGPAAAMGDGLGVCWSSDWLGRGQIICTCQ